MSTSIELPQQRVNLPASTQATAIEQTRAIEEVRAMVVVAQQFPRSLSRALEQMREACAQPALAERAFFRFPRAGQQVTGPSIHLARELARIWGNIDYGIKELDRDDEGGESEMLAYAWDLQTNARPSSTFIVPHATDTKRDGRKKLTDLRDIYENNANQGARRLREAIFAVIPVWFVEEAKANCRKTIEHGGGIPLAQRVSTITDYYAVKFGVKVNRLEQKVGTRVDDWSAYDVASLEVIGRSLHAGETTVDAEFPLGGNTVSAPAASVAATDFLPQTDTGAAEPPARAAAVEASGDHGDAPAPVSPDGPITDATRRRLFAFMGELVGTDADDQRDFLTDTLGRVVESRATLTEAEANRAGNRLQAWQNGDTAAVWVRSEGDLFKGVGQ